MVRALAGLVRAGEVSVHKMEYAKNPNSPFWRD
jgi:hypothetical protein